MRRIGLIALCGMLISAIGCGGENRADVVTNVNNQLGEASSKVKQIREKLKEATDKGEKAPSEKELKEAADLVKELNAFPAALQQILVKNSRRAPLSEDEKREARRRGAANLNETLKELNTSVHDLEQQVAVSKTKYGDKLRDFTDKLETAMGEFRNLGAQQK